MAKPQSPSTYQRIYSVIRQVPAGRVATYGQIASLADLAGHARQVGYALKSLPEKHDVPWHRIINARGEVSARATPGWDNLQRTLLEGESVVFDARGRVDLDRFRWEP